MMRRFLTRVNSSSELTKSFSRFRFFNFRFGWSFDLAGGGLTKLEKYLFKFFTFPTLDFRSFSLWYLWNDHSYYTSCFLLWFLLELLRYFLQNSLKIIYQDLFKRGINLQCLYFFRRNDFFPFFQLHFSRWWNYDICRRNRTRILICLYCKVLYSQIWAQNFFVFDFTFLSFFSLTKGISPTFQKKNKK